MKKISITFAVVVLLYVGYLGYQNNYHWLLHPHGAIMAASDSSNSVSGMFGNERLWKGITPEIGFFFLEHVVDLSEKPEWETVTWLSYCLNQYQKPFEDSDPERVERIYKVAQYLIDSGVNVNERPKNGFTSVEGAILISDFKMFEFLARNGADLNKKMTAKGREGLTLREFAEQILNKTDDTERSEELRKIVKYIKRQNITMHSTQTLVPRAS